MKHLDHYYFAFQQTEQELVHHIFKFRWKFVAAIWCVQCIWVESH